MLINLETNLNASRKFSVFKKLESGWKHSNLFKNLIQFLDFQLSYFYLRRSQQVNKWSNLRFLVVLVVVEKFLISGQWARITIRAIIDGVPDLGSDHCDHLWPDVTRCDQCYQISNAAKSIILEVNDHVFDHCDNHWPLVTICDQSYMIKQRAIISSNWVPDLNSDQCDQ